MPNPTLTVLLPVRNGMPFLPETLASLEAQTFRDFSVIIWDNGSTDGSADEAHRWIPKRLPGRVVTDRPLPLHECLAQMVVEAETEFCARMDADDICLPTRFERQVRFLDENLAVSLVGSQIECVDPAGNRLPQESWAQYATQHEDIVTQLLFNCPFCHPSILFRTEAVRQAGNYAVPSPVEDLDLYLRLAQTARLANLDSVELRYRLHPKSICAAARVGNRHETLAIEAVARYCHVLYGLSPETYFKLRRKACLLSIVPLLFSVIHRARGRLPFSFWRTITSPTFLHVGRCLTSPRDYLSKTVFRILSFFTRA